MTFRCRLCRRSKMRSDSLRRHLTKWSISLGIVSGVNVRKEQLRKRLISNLSHDLRTPLTVLNSHSPAVRKEEISERGQQSIMQMENKIINLDSLIENLLSYTLMTSGRYPLKLEQQDVLRLVRESAAAWFPVWEKESMEVDIDMRDQPLVWTVDKQGFRRILDNLFQNVYGMLATGNI